MIVIGASGFAKEILAVFAQREEFEQISQNLFFFDDVNTQPSKLLYQKYPILTDKEALYDQISLGNNEVVLGLGNPKHRKMFYETLSERGAIFPKLISPKAHVSDFGNSIEVATCVMTGTIITADVKIGIGCLINLNCTIGHDVSIGDFCEFSPGTHISGRCTIGNNCIFGTNSTVIPDISIGNNVVIAAGAVVTQNLPDNCMAAGVPAVIKKRF